MKGVARLGALVVLTLGAGCGSSTPSTSGRSERATTSVTANLDCENCHTTSGWRIGQGRRGEGFDHRQTGFPLTGRHADAGCTSCHAGDRPARRECASCHADFHQGQLGGACDECHSSRDFPDVRAVELHRRTQLPLTGMHVLADCTECHQRTTSRTWSAVPADCIACHDADYRRTDIHPLHTGTGTTAPFPRDCTQCHTAIGWLPAFVDPTMITGTTAPLVAADHDARFPVSSGPHRGLACESCHVAPASPRTFQCTGCHAHQLGTLATQHRGIPLLDGPACLSCHSGGSRR